MHGERFVADRLAGAPDRVAEALRLVLVDDRHPPVTADRAEPLGDLGLALRLERTDQGVVGTEVGLDRRLVAAAHHDDVVDPGTERLVDHDLQRRLVADREQFLRNGLRRGEETGAHSGGGNDGTAHLHETDDIFSTPMPTYVYKFVDTGETIEVQQAFTDATLTEFAHPDSGEVLAVKKVFTPVGVTFKGSGFFKTDNRGKKSASETGSKKDGDSKSATRRVPSHSSSDSKSSDSKSSESKAPTRNRPAIRRRSPTTHVLEVDGELRRRRRSTKSATPTSS